MRSSTPATRAAQIAARIIASDPALLGSSIQDAIDVRDECLRDFRTTGAPTSTISRQCEHRTRSPVVGRPASKRRSQDAQRTRDDRGIPTHQDTIDPMDALIGPHAARPRRRTQYAASESPTAHPERSAGPTCRVSRPLARRGPCPSRDRCPRPESGGVHRSGSDAARTPPDAPAGRGGSSRTRRP